jgi:bifunctional non-homologous end joining protein LigD
MTEQLTFRLEPELPNLPSLRPMLARAADEPFDSADHLFEPSWGGVRALASIGPAETPGLGKVRLTDGDGDPIDGHFPELAGMAARVAARSALLDGELVVVDADGRADPDAMAARLAGRPGRPVAFLAFDLLHLDGRPLLNLPLVRRRELLRRVLRPGDEVLAVPTFATEGRALFAAAAAQGIAGVMARRRTSPYLPGVRSRLWRFVACSGAPAGQRASDLGATPAAPAEPDDGDGHPTGRVIALIRRLPLPLDEPD